MAKKRIEVSVMDPLLPVEALVAHAEQQRKRIHHDIAGLRASLRQAMDARKLARENLPAACGTVGLLGLILGYRFGGMFTRD